MSEERNKAHELYLKHGLQRASFIAFDHMQKSTDETDIEFWLHVINQIALLDIQSLETNEASKWGNA